ncbi:hypothetical protein LIA77_05638 [Sarocladium implicatum]|nr:hypothetical protein LIA77_05638 [Sarocladium implicatum]
MRSSVLAGAFAFAGLSAAFSDSAPWIVASTEPFKAGVSNDKIQTSATKDFLSTCPTQRYVVLTQAGLHYSDLVAEGGNPMKKLWSVIESDASTGSYIVPEVVGSAVDSVDIKAHIEESCRRQDKTWVMGQADLASLGEDNGQRIETLAANDAALEDSVMSMLRSDSYTLIYYGIPPNAEEPAVYEPEFEEQAFVNLKRNVQGQPLRRASNETDWNKLPLFEKYQFFTPGIFMGLLAVILIGSILTVGLRALSSLEVSYGAFEKDMGPAAQKKQQ